MPQPRQRNRHFFLVAAAHSIGDNVDLVAGAKQVESCLGNTNVALNTDDDTG